MKNLAVEVQGLTKTFGTKVALSNVSFSVPAGTMIGFLGPNGAGKTTTIRCMMDFIRPTTGSITIFGKDARANSTELKKVIGFLPSDMQLNPAWTVTDHLKLVGDIRGSRTKSDELMKLLELDANMTVKQLSTGNKQKLSIIVAFAGRPQLLVLDEPTKGLDPVLQNIIYDLLRTFTEEGNTVFFSSHNLSEVQRMCDSVILIKDGEVVTEQGMDEIRGANLHIIDAVTKAKLNRDKLNKLGARITYFTDHHVNIKVKGDIDPLIRYLAEQTLIDLTVSHASLEDLFLGKYKG